MFWGLSQNVANGGSKRSKWAYKTSEAEGLRGAENKNKTSIVKIPCACAQVPVDMWITSKFENFLHLKNYTKLYKNPISAFRNFLIQTVFKAMNGNLFELRLYFKT